MLRTDLPSIVLAMLILGDFAYTAGFAHIPTEVRLAAAGALFGTQALLGLVTLWLRPSVWLTRYAAVVLVLPFCWLISAAFIGESSDALRGLRYAGPFLAGVFFLAYRDKLPLEIIFWSAAATVVFALIWALVSPRFLMGGIERFAPFQIPYGVDQLAAGQTVHPSANAVVICVILAHRTALAGAGPRVVFWIVAATGAVVVVGLFSTQSQLGLLAYFAAHLFLTGRTRGLAKVLIAVVAVAALGAVVVEKELRNADSRQAVQFEAEELGTGRMGLWLERIEILQGYSALQLVVGRGIGYDLILAKDQSEFEAVAHSPYLTYLLESGIVGLSAFLVLLLLPMRALGRPTLPIYITILLTTLVGNGIPLRGMTFILAWLAIGVAANRPGRKHRFIRSRVRRHRPARSTGRRHPSIRPRQPVLFR